MLGEGESARAGGSWQVFWNPSVGSTACPSSDPFLRVGSLSPPPFLSAPLSHHPPAHKEVSHLRTFGKTQSVWFHTANCFMHSVFGSALFPGVVKSNTIWLHKAMYSVSWDCGLCHHGVPGPLKVMCLCPVASGESSSE